jgi:hypothetical protein
MVLPDLLVKVSTELPLPPPLTAFSLIESMLVTYHMQSVGRSSRTSCARQVRSPLPKSLCVTMVAAR